MTTLTGTLMRSTPDAQAEMLAAHLLAPKTSLDQNRRAASKAAMLRELRRTVADVPAGAGSRDGLASVTHHTEVQSDLFPGGCRMADLEPITAERAQEVVHRVANVLIERIFES